VPEFDLTVLVPYIPEFWEGFKQTLTFSLSSLGLAVFIGLTVALARLSDIPPLRMIARTYVDVVRGTPGLVQMFFIYYGMPSLGVSLSAPVAGVLALGINSGGYMAEFFRAGILSVEVGQVEAGRSLGMSRGQVMRRVVLPQAALNVVPPTAGEFTNLIKGTSLLSTISITEMTRVAQQVVAVTFRPIEAYLAITVVYFLLNALVSQGSLWLERFLRRSQGLG
jgi:polar amino acid transport system permease protein